MKNSNRNTNISWAGLIVILLFSAALIAFSGSIYRSLSKIGRVKGTESIYTAGTYTGTARGYGGTITATLTVTDKDITDLTVTGPKETPDLGGRALSSMPHQILKKQTVEIDGIAGATVTSKAVRESVEKALADARGEITEEQGPEILSASESSLKDGHYIYTASDFDDAGYKDTVSMAVKNGIITECRWDSLDRDGNSKSNLSMEGAYVMTPDGPLWYEQAETVANYVISHQSTADLANADGYATDAVASVSINIYPFLNGLRSCFSHAA